MEQRRARIKRLLQAGAAEKKKPALEQSPWFGSSPPGDEAVDGILSGAMERRRQKRGLNVETPTEGEDFRWVEPEERNTPNRLSKSSDQWSSARQLARALLMAKRLPEHRSLKGNGSPDRAPAAAGRPR